MVSAKNAKAMITANAKLNKQKGKRNGVSRFYTFKGNERTAKRIPDYLVVMRKPGDNPEPITHTNESFPVEIWQKYASPIWTDINPSDTLQYRSARDNEDEKHICPLQLTVIRRALNLWTNPNDIVLTPFMGIGSEVVTALENGRRAVGIELKDSYYRQAEKNARAVTVNEQLSLW